MDRLWAPWRIRYIQPKKKTKGCLLCKLGKDKAGDYKNLVFLRSKTGFSVLNKFPYNNGHVLVCPFSHKGELKQLTKEEILDLIMLLMRAQNLLRKVLKPHGYNIGINIGNCAGAGIKKHIHIHLVPRWEGDSNFISVVSQTKVISQSLDELFKILKREIRNG